MPRITLDLIRKRSEHNDGELSTLEEIALHQEDIEKIELIDKTCRNLKILLLQHNLVSKIENLGKLKRLEYLNLALNNIEAIENLEGLESLKKLDLTVNFVADLRDIEKLRQNENLEQLFLMGNPCADYEAYRSYVVATLTHLKELDSRVIERSERIRALQIYARLEDEVTGDYARYKATKIARNSCSRERLLDEFSSDRETHEEEDDLFWKETSRHTPEDRVAIAERLRRKEEMRNRRKTEEERNEYVPKLFSPDGRPYNVNRPKVSFKLDDENNGNIVVLDVAVYKYLDTSYLDVDVHPTYVRVTIKGKVLQLTLPCEVSVQGSTAKRNATTGSLIVTMPRVNPIEAIRKFDWNSMTPKTRKNVGAIESFSSSSLSSSRSRSSRREYLEIGPPTDDLDVLLSIERFRSGRWNGKRLNGTDEMISDVQYAVDESNVPPLE